MATSRTRTLSLGAALAAGVLALGAKLSLIRKYGSDVPYMDEWDAVGRHLLVPRAAGELHLWSFFLPQNEHRIVLARLMAYALAVSNGQWDPLLEMTAGALVHSAFCAALVLLARRFASGVRFAAAAVAIVLVFALPFNWENTLQGLQVQQYLLDMGAVAALFLCVPAPPLGGRWWAGFAAAAASLGAMSSGFLAAAVVLGAALLRSALRRRFGLRDATACALLVALCAAGILSTARVPGHDVLRAHSAREWLLAEASALSWPLITWPAAVVVLQAPIVLLGVGRIRRREASGDEAALFALAAWVALQVAAIAYAREGFGMFRSPRYMDLYSLGAVVNALALAVLLARRPVPAPLALLAAAWSVAFLVGLWNLDRGAQQIYLGRVPGLKAVERHYVRAFLASGDLPALRSAPSDQLPYPNADELGRFLSAPGIRSMLPVGIRPALVLAADAGTSGFESVERSGLPPGAPGRGWVARRGPARFVSRPLAAGLLPYLHVLLAGSRDLETSAVRLEWDGSQRQAQAGPPLRPDWSSADLAVPPQAGVRLVAEVAPGEHWLAFTEPVELGRGSLANRWLLRQSGSIAAVGGLLLLCAFAGLLASDLQEQRRQVSLDG
jgi:hypothetical protein